MSYGMMVCVQLDKKEEFDRLWKWTRTYMYMDEGIGKELFLHDILRFGRHKKCGRIQHRTGKSILLWHCSLHQEDGETERAFLITAGRQKRSCMSVCIRENRDIRAIRCREPSNKLIKFVPGLDFSDPSYHLPAFYELFAEYADERRIVVLERRCRSKPSLPA